MSLAPELISALTGRSIDSTVHVSSRDNAIVNRLNKTKVEKEVDHEAERQERLKAEGRKKKAVAEERVGLYSSAGSASRTSDPLSLVKVVGTQGNTLTRSKEIFKERDITG